MRAFVELCARLKARPDSEHEQAILRILIFAVVLAYMWATCAPGSVGTGSGESDLVILNGLGCALALALA